MARSNEGHALAGESRIEKLPEIPGYEILRQIGAGGMGTVYVGRDVQLQRSVAIKFNSSPMSGASGPEQQQRFRREAQTMAQVDHPNLAQIFTLGEVGEVQYIVMELVEGESLHDLLERDQVLSERHALDLVRQAACGLAEAWRLEIVHRDVKPENILISRGGVVKVVDFGLARGADPLSGGFTVTQSGNVVGTIRYISPERVDGQRGDFRSDIYALGLVLYRLITGQHAYDAESPAAMLMKHIREPLPDVRAAAPEVSDATCRLLGWMTAKNPEERPASGPALLDAIDGALIASGQQLPNSITGPGSPWDATIAAPGPGPGHDASDELQSEPSIAPLGARSGTADQRPVDEQREDNSSASSAAGRAVAGPAVGGDSSVQQASSPRRRWPVIIGGLLVAAILGLTWFSQRGEPGAGIVEVESPVEGPVESAIASETFDHDPEQIDQAGAAIAAQADAPPSGDPSVEDPSSSDTAVPTVVGPALHAVLTNRLEASSTGVLELDLEASGWVVSDLEVAVPRVRVSVDRVIYPLLFLLRPGGEIRMLHPNDAAIGSTPAFGPGTFEVPEGTASAATNRELWQGTLYLFASTTPFEGAGQVVGAQPSDGAMIYPATPASASLEVTIAEDFVARLPVAEVSDLVSLPLP